MEILKVSSRSNPNSVAGAMAGVVRQSGAVEVQVVGAGALNQAVKAIAIARGYLTPSNVDLVCVPTFADIEIDGESRTAIRLSVEHRGHKHSSDADGKAATDGKAAGDGKAAADGQSSSTVVLDGQSDGSRQPAHANI